MVAGSLDYSRWVSGGVGGNGERLLSLMLLTLFSVLLVHP